MPLPRPPHHVQAEQQAQAWLNANNWFHRAAELQRFLHRLKDGTLSLDQIEITDDGEIEIKGEAKPAPKRSPRPRKKADA